MATKKEMFLEIENLASTMGKTEIIDFCRKEIELLDKKKAKAAEKTSKKMEEREFLAAQILEVLDQANCALRTMEIATSLGISPQKATPVMKFLLTKEQVEVRKAKGTTYYVIVR